MSANLATDLLCEEMVHRRYAVDQAYLQGDILPIVKHLAFAGRFRRIDLQPICSKFAGNNRGFLTMENGYTAGFVFGFAFLCLGFLIPLARDR